MNAMVGCTRNIETAWHMHVESEKPMHRISHKGGALKIALKLYYLIFQTFIIEPPFTFDNFDVLLCIKISSSSKIWNFYPSSAKWDLKTSDFFIIRIVYKNQKKISTFLWKLQQRDFIIAEVVLYYYFVVKLNSSTEFTIKKSIVP